MQKTVAIVGRPNVGKSTLFNRLISSKTAIVHDESGITRDRLFDTGEWKGREFTVMDTGGFMNTPEDIFEEGIRRQVLATINEADLLLFMVDVMTGITEEDQQFAKIVRQAGTETFLVVNKVDNNERRNEIYQFYKLGFEKMFPVSSEHGGGTGDLLDEVVDYLNIEEEPDTEDDENIPAFAILGRPNSGKSTLLNNLLEEERSLVTDQAGTTRDATKTLYEKFDRKFYLVDTAGLRKKSKVTDNVEFYSVVRALKVIDNCQVGLLMIDAERGLESQDMNILNLLLDRKKGIVVLVNKWDLIDKETGTSKDFVAEIRKKTEPFTDYPIIFISALHKQRILKAIDAALEVHENRQRKIASKKLNDALEEITTKNPPPSEKGKFVKIKYVAQLKRTNPHFKFFCNFPQYIKEPYKRYLENELRKRFNFTGVPVTITLSKK